MFLTDPERVAAARNGNHFWVHRSSPFGSLFDQLYQIQSFYSQKINNPISGRLEQWISEGRQELF
jgi:hypothetical protein